MVSFFSKWTQAKNWLKMATDQGIWGSLYGKERLKKPSCKILCVDDDRNFCLFIQRLAYSLGIQLDVVYSFQEAKQVLENECSYQALIIDGHLLDGSGFELVAWVREKKGLKVPIGFISRLYQDATSFRILKESFKVDYVLEKPIHPPEILKLLIQICHLTLTPSSLEPFSEDLLSDLKLSYQKSIFDKIERLEKMILIVQKNLTVKHLSILKEEVHKIAGSAGSYGYMAVSELCKNLELDLIKQMDLAQRGHFDHQWISTLDDFFTQIKLHFQIDLSESDKTNFRSHYMPCLYVLDEDQVFLNTCRQLNQELHFDILTEANPDKALQTLLSADFYPQIFLLKADYPSSILTGYELIQAFYRENEHLSMMIGLMVQEHALEKQIEALKRGMTFILTKPLLLPWLLPLLDQTPFRALPLSYKILVIDDDLDICHYILKTLKYSGLEIRSLQDLQDLEKMLKSYQPDLILLNAQLSHPSGITLLNYLRKNLKYEKTLVGMLTMTQPENSQIQACYDNDAEMLFKPLEQGVLQRKIALLLKKQMAKTLDSTPDSLMELANIQTFKRYIEELQKRFYPPLPKICIIFEIESFISISQKHKIEIVKMISLALEDLLKKYEMAAYLGKGRFALVFQGYDAHFVQLFIHAFLIKIYSKIKKNLIKKKDFYINECLLILSAEEKFDDILQRGEQLLLLAQQQTNQPVRLITQQPLIVSKEVLIFHDETQSLDVIKSVLEEQHFKITLFSEMNEKLLQSLLPVPLLILMGSLAETKGLCLLKKVFLQNQMQIPLLYFSYPLEQDYLQQLLSEVNYFKAPFGLILLMPHV